MMCTAKKRGAWSTRSARSFTSHSAWVTDNDKTTRDSDVTSDATHTSVTSSARARKKRQLAGTETDIMQQMLFPTAKSPLPLSHLTEPTQADSMTRTKQVGTNPTERKRLPSSHGNATDLTTPAVNMHDSDHESNASADTYTVDSDGKEELRRERARIDVAFGIVSDSASDEHHQTSTDNSGAQLQDAEVNDIDDDKNDRSTQLHGDSDEADQPCLKRTKNQTLFPKYTDGSASSCVNKSGCAPDLKSSGSVNRNPDDARDFAVVDGDVSVAVDREADQSAWTGSQSSVKRLQSVVDGVAVHDTSNIDFARQNLVTNAAGGNSTVVVDTKSEEPMLTKSSKGDDESFEDNDDDDHDGSQPTAVSSLKPTENYREVKTTNLFH